MLGFDAMEDDAAPGQWIVVEMPDEANPTTPDATVARFYGEHARRSAEQWCKYKEAERADPLGEAGFGPLGKPSLGGWAMIASIVGVVGLVLTFYCLSQGHPR